MFKVIQIIDSLGLWQFFVLAVYLFGLGTVARMIRNRHDSHPSNDAGFSGWDYVYTSRREIKPNQFKYRARQRKN